MHDAICNACRYCEGYCAVFPAMERRLDVRRRRPRTTSPTSATTAASASTPASTRRRTSSASTCRARWRRCAPQSYEQYAWPAAFASAFAATAVATAMVLAAALIGVLLAAFADPRTRAALRRRCDARQLLRRHAARRRWSWCFGAVSDCSCSLALVVGLARFWRDTGESLGALSQPGAAARRRSRDALTLRIPRTAAARAAPIGEEQRTPLRRIFHHFTFYGFLLCFAATCVATIYHYVLRLDGAVPATPACRSSSARSAASGCWSGPAGLLVLERRRDPALGDPDQRGMDRALHRAAVPREPDRPALLAFRETRGDGRCCSSSTSASCSRSS